MEYRSPPGYRPEDVLRVSTCAPSPKQSARDWIRIPREIGWARPVRHPARLAISGARGAIWAHIQE